MPQERKVPSSDSSRLPYHVVRSTRIKNSKTGNSLGATLGVVKRPEGNRFYYGLGTGNNDYDAYKSSVDDLGRRALFTPADSVKTKNVRRTMHPKEFNRVFELLKYERPSYLKSEKL